MRVAFGTIMLAAMPVSAQVSPGMWEITSTVTAMSAPGLPPAAQSTMKKPMTIRHCVTAEEARRGPYEMLKGDKSCRFTRYAASGGNIDAVMTCAQRGTSMTVNTKGRYTPTTFSSTANMAISGPQPMKISAQASGKRTGAC